MGHQRSYTTAPYSLPPFWSNWMGLTLPWEPLHTARGQKGGEKSEENVKFRDGERTGQEVVGKEENLGFKACLRPLFFSSQLKYKSRKNLDNKRRASKHTHATTGTHKERARIQSPALFLSLSFKHTHPNQTVRQRDRVQTQWWLHWLLVHVFSSPTTKLIGHSLKPLSKQRHWWLCVCAYMFVCVCVYIGDQDVTWAWPIRLNQSLATFVPCPITSLKRREECRQLLQIKTGQISYQTPSSLHPFPTSSVRRQNAYHQGNPLITTATHSITVRRRKNQSFHWWQPSYYIRTTYLNRLSVNQLSTATTAICRLHITHTHTHISHWSQQISIKPLQTTVILM